VKLPETHDELMEMMLGGKLTNDELLELAKAHTHRDLECEVCSIEEDVDDWPLFELIFNNYKESISTEVLEYLADNLVIQCDRAPTGGGTYESLFMEFAFHPISSKSMLEQLLWWFEEREFYDEAYDGEPPRRPKYESEFRQLTEHPLATDKIVHEFLYEVHNASEQCDGSVDACEACQSLLEEHWEK
jgi:hypothetical protein